MISLVSKPMTVFVLGFGYGLEVIKLFSCSTQLSIKFIFLIKYQKRPKSMEVSDMNYQNQSFILLINIKMPTILTFMSRINFMLS